jgi:hypothetical protein
MSKLNPMTNKSGKMTGMRVFGTLLLIAAIAVAVIFGIKWHNANERANKLAKDPQAVARQTVADTVTAVGKLTVLPNGETPTLATVTDITKLKEQPFFANAQNGDKVLIYTQAKKAYLYRPTTNKVINIAPLVIGNGSSSTDKKQ